MASEEVEPGFTSSPTIAYESLERRGGAPSAWGVWGDDDRVGSLNRLDARTVQFAAESVRSGRLVPLNWQMSMPEPALYGRQGTVVSVRATSPFAQDDILDNFNTQASTQWDGFRHIKLPDLGYYNGLPESAHGVHHMHDHGVAGRGVLADVASWLETSQRSVEFGSPEALNVDDLKQTLEFQGTQLRAGDVLLIRTGWVRWYESLSEEERRAIAADSLCPAIGLDPSEEMAAFLWDAQLSAVAADNPSLEVSPIGALASADLLNQIAVNPSIRYRVSLHSRLLVLLGIPIGELFYLEQLARECENHSRYEFFFVSVPMNHVGGIGTPANAIAIF